MSNSDHAHHAGSAYHALHDTVAFDKAISRSIALTSEDDTLIIVTADHSHVMSIGHYSDRGNPILGKVFDGCFTLNPRKQYNGP